MHACRYVLLFLIFMLTSEAAPPAEEEDEEYDHASRTLAVRIDEQVFSYIRGKAIIAALVASTASATYFLVGLNLWLVFGVLTFFLNFIPSVGLFIAVALPMPLVLLEPAFGIQEQAIAFFLPLLCSTVAKDVLEPLLIGQATSLRPIVMLLSIMLFGTIWGMVGMIMAVPMTAVARIVLKNIEHPLPRLVADILGGTQLRFRRFSLQSPDQRPYTML